MPAKTTKKIKRMADSDTKQRVVIDMSWEDHMNAGVRMGKCCLSALAFCEANAWFSCNVVLIISCRLNADLILVH